MRPHILSTGEYELWNAWPFTITIDQTMGCCNLYWCYTLAEHVISSTSHQVGLANRVRPSHPALAARCLALVRTLFTNFNKTRRALLLPKPDSRPVRWYLLLEREYWVGATRHCSHSASSTKSTNKLSRKVDMWRAYYQAPRFDIEIHR